MKPPKNINSYADRFRFYDILRGKESIPYFNIFKYSLKGDHREKPDRRISDNRYKSRFIPTKYFR